MTLNATQFYDRLAPLFDVMTNWERRLAYEGPWLREQFEAHGARSVLDAACGTGGHALAFAGWGLEAVGTDASPAMIELARKKGGAATFEVAALGEVVAKLGRRFDAAVCLGNSLPHLISDDDLHAALLDLRACLKPGGPLITHNLNYDLRWEKRPRFFGAQSGVLDEQERLVWRFADYHDDTGLLTFHTALFTRGNDGWSVEVNSTPQRPLFRATLSGALEKAGFRVEEVFGNLAGEPFEADASPDLVVVAVAEG
jgi:SAM-dependent methyltransferase